MMWNSIFNKVKSGDRKALARCISLVENEYEGYDYFLQNIETADTPIIGITGPPGAGKSTLTDALIACFVAENKKVALLCVDPSSAFNLGSLLGDRVRMSRWHNEPNVYIRSLATRGSLGGLNPKIIEITDVLKTAEFDYIIIETVGVGQSEIEIAGLADITVVVLVPESGDEIQMMKAGLMEIANIFVVNKSDRPQAATMLKNLHLILPPKTNDETPTIDIVKTIATKNIGIDELYSLILKKMSAAQTSDKKYHLLAEKAFLLIQQKRMRGVSKIELYNTIKKEKKVNLYKLVSSI
jgi:LAO/AO transport system kinase